MGCEEVQKKEEKREKSAISTGRMLRSSKVGLIKIGHSIHTLFLICYFMVTTLTFHLLKEDCYLGTMKEDHYLETITKGQAKVCKNTRTYKLHQRVFFVPGQKPNYGLKFVIPPPALP